MMVMGRVDAVPRTIASVLVTFFSRRVDRLIPGDALQVRGGYAVADRKLSPAARADLRGGRVVGIQSRDGGRIGGDGTPRRAWAVSGFTAASDGDKDGRRSGCTDHFQSDFSRYFT